MSPDTRAMSDATSTAPGFGPQHHVGVGRTVGQAEPVADGEDPLAVVDVADRVAVDVDEQHGHVDQPAGAGGGERTRVGTRRPGGDAPLRVGPLQHLVRRTGPLRLPDPVDVVPADPLVERQELVDPDHPVGQRPQAVLDADVVERAQREPRLGIGAEEVDVRILQGAPRAPGVRDRVVDLTRPHQFLVAPHRRVDVGQVRGLPDQARHRAGETGDGQALGVGERRTRRVVEPAAQQPAVGHATGDGERIREGDHRGDGVEQPG